MVSPSTFCFLQDNGLQKLCSLATLPALRSLDLSFNALAGLAPTLKCLAPLSNLISLHLHDNPVEQEGGAERPLLPGLLLGPGPSHDYFAAVRLAVPWLRELDDQILQDAERRLNLYEAARGSAPLAHAVMNRLRGGGGAALLAASRAPVARGLSGIPGTHLVADIVAIECSGTAALVPAMFVHYAHRTYGAAAHAAASAAPPATAGMIKLSTLAASNFGFNSTSTSTIGPAVASGRRPAVPAEPPIGVAQPKAVEASNETAAGTTSSSCVANYTSCMHAVDSFQRLNHHIAASAAHVAASTTGAPLAPTAAVAAAGTFLPLALHRASAAIGYPLTAPPNAAADSATPSATLQSCQLAYLAKHGNLTRGCCAAPPEYASYIAAAYQRAAVAIQSGYRGFKGRGQAKHHLADAQRRKTNRAATLIQASWRGHSVRGGSLLQRLRREASANRQTLVQVRASLKR